ncbi:hypothetical protein MZO28_09740 [Enterococcus faecalis]|uniref:DUF7006 family protein n=1 Tax=Enterococcus TaxID=1350 RepID=UPI0019DA7836|nr:MULTISPECIES: hypothetical protein [Enterococcus]EGO8741068.1 hypothetical protein [Enterococcus faecalis]MDK4352132.1 hypothetical protein [Enterococcus thailandicus]MDT2733095.1 hypothetical protein [Enterococcus thailandicus]MDT2742961.1 hypothetical protein [Enterococcus asini]UZN27900.1 hypothetical protein MZO28_09740 [Enterococcus faecalis]
MWQDSLRHLFKKKMFQDVRLQEYSENILREFDFLIENISPDNLRTTITKINVIEEKASLLMFFLEINEEEQLTSDRIIELIEKGYRDTFLEKISFGNDLTNRYSLLEILE